MVDRLEAKYGSSVDLYLYAEADKNYDAQRFAVEHGINGVPTIVVVGADGAEIERFVGTTPERTVARSIEQAKRVSAAVNAAENP